MGRKWSSSSRVFLVLGGVFAMVAFMLVHSYAARVQRLDAAIGRPVPVVVAATPLGRGTVLEETMLRIRSYPASYAPPEAVTEPKWAAGRVLLAPLARGEPLTEGRLAPPAGPVAALVPPGLRAVTVPTSLPLRSVAAGDRVDVLATYPGRGPHTETVASGLEVLRTMTPRGASAGGFGSEGVTQGGTTLILLVAPDQAEALAFARAFADISVTIDGPEEVVAAEGP